MQRAGQLSHLGDLHPSGTQAQIGQWLLALALRLLFPLQTVVCGEHTIWLLEICFKESELSNNFNKIYFYFYNFSYFHSLVDNDFTCCMDQISKGQFLDMGGLGCMAQQSMPFENWKTKNSHL